MARFSRFKTSQTGKSKGHIALGEILKRKFPLNKIYQEYSYDLILKAGYNKFGVEEEYRDQLLMNRARKLRADWVVLDLAMVFEFQGEHHYAPVSYSKTEWEGESESNFQRRLMLDAVKRIICREANFAMIEVPHYEELTDASLQKLIDKSLRSGV